MSPLAADRDRPRRFRPGPAQPAHAVLPALFTLAALGALSCGGDDGPTAPAPAAETVSAVATYDGSFTPAIGAFLITDYRSKMVAAAGGDSVDLYANMESYETRDAQVFYKPGLSGRPVVLYIHGGAWIDGYRDWYTFTAESFTDTMDYVTVVGNYRLTSDEVFPASLCPTRDSEMPAADQKAAWYPDDIRDCADALQWTVDHAAEFGGDPDKIFVFGHSAGGHLAALLATHDDFASLRPHIRGLISMSGAYSLQDLNQVVFSQAMAITFGTATDAAVLDEASPATYVVAGMDLPPFLVLYADDDLPSLVPEALAFSTKLEQLGYAVETELLEGYDHVSEMQAIESPSAAPTARIIRFIEEHL